MTSAARHRPPYPAHLVRFPAKALGFNRRHRGPSFMHIVYLGTHPVALLMSMVVTLLMIEFVVAWIMLVVSAWAMWWCAITCWWAFQVAVAALRR